MKPTERLRTVDAAAVPAAGVPARRLMFVVNNAAFFESHRLPVARAAQAAGWQVQLCTGHEASATLAAHAMPRLQQAGIVHTRLAFRSAGLNPLTELRGLVQLVRLMRRERPDVVHCASPKGVLYGALAARLSGVPALVIAVSGVGFTFTDGGASRLRGVLRALVGPLSSWAWNHRRKRVIVQNAQDRSEVCARGWAGSEETVLLPGSGVDLPRYTALPLAPRDDIVLLPARLLRDKGVLEFVQAARGLRAQLPGWRFVLVGTADYDNPSAVAPGEIERWVAEGVVQWWGHREDMPAVYGRVRIVCLPSYREGMPRCLLEAAAAGCAVITTDVPGCRDAIEPGRSGLLVPPRDAAALATALLALCTDPARIDRLARAGRELARRRFSQETVIQRTLAIYDEVSMLSKPPTPERPPVPERPLVLVQLNEIDLELVRRYRHRLKLPHFERLLDGHVIETRAEAEYALLEPWIQWPSVYTGLSAAGHGLRRLGDVVGHGVPQIFEQLEQHGLRVGCLSPINAENRLREPAYFLPDPWTATPGDGSWWSQRLGECVTQMVNDNAKVHAKWRSLAMLALAAARFARPRHWPDYARLVFLSRGLPWRKAMVLDLLLTDVHHVLMRRHRPHFASVFFNAGAHIQHHYLLASPVVRTALRNPDGYVPAGADPVGDALQLYDRLLGSLLHTHGLRGGIDWIVATGLSQRPYDASAHYWRLREHDSFLRRAGIAFVRVRPRMSRDFLVECADAAQARAAEERLAALHIEPGRQRLFGEVDNRGRSLFVTLTHAGAVDDSHHVVLGGQVTPLAPELALVALKNGMHQSRGHACFSPGMVRLAPADGAHVSALHDTLARHFGMDPTPDPAAAEQPRPAATVPRIDQGQTA